MLLHYLNLQLLRIVFSCILCQRCLREVKGLTALSVGKECGIACCRCLYHFVLNREEIHCKLTRLRIGIDYDTLLLKGNGSTPYRVHRLRGKRVG